MTTENGDLPFKDNETLLDDDDDYEDLEKENEEKRRAPKCY